MKNINLFPQCLNFFAIICLAFIMLGQSSCKKDSPNPIVVEEQCVNVVEELGVDNTGLTDCSSTLQNAIDQGKNLCFPPGKYRIDKGLWFKSDSTKHIFNEATLFSPNPIRLITIQGNDIAIHNLVINMYHTSVDRFAIQIRKPSNNVKLVNCKVENLKGQAGGKYQVGLYIELDGVINFEIDSCKFKNIELKNDGNIKTEYDFANGIYLSTSEYTNPSSGKITNCEIINVFNTTNGIDDRIDADGIRFAGATDNLPIASSKPRIEVLNCSFINCQKRGVKISGSTDIKINNIKIFNDRSDIYQYDGVRVHESQRITLNNVDISGNIVRGISLGNKSKDIVISEIKFERQPTTKHGIANSWALRIELDGKNKKFIENVNCQNIQVKNSKGVRIYGANNIIIEKMTIFDIETNSFDDDGEGSSNTTYFDNLIEVDSSKEVTLSKVNVLNPRENVPTALRIQNCQNININESWFRGWGNSVFEVEETLGESCNSISLNGGGVEQIGFLESWSNDFRTVSFISENNGSSENGIEKVQVDGWHIICTQIPANLPEFDYICLFETPNSEFNNFIVEYKGQTNNSLSSLLFLTDVDQTSFTNIELQSNSEVRCIYLIEAANTSLDNVKVCVPNSWIGVSTSCVNTDFGVFYVLNDFNQTIANSLDQPSYVITTCQ